MEIVDGHQNSTALPEAVTLPSGQADIQEMLPDLDDITWKVVMHRPNFQMGQTLEKAKNDFVTHQKMCRQEAQLLHRQLKEKAAGPSEPRLFRIDQHAVEPRAHET